MKLWQKDNTSLSERVDAFTVGRDREFDLLLAKYDVQGSLAHVQMLGAAGLMSAEETAAAMAGLKTIAAEIEQGTFTIPEEAEDVHSQVEALLTDRIGTAGKKIHAGRSRNDQVAVDIKLYLKDVLLRLHQSSGALFQLLLQQADRFRNHLLPGYTHLQVAMPSSAGLWLGAYAESLIDDNEMLAAAYAIADKNPLGSGAGYGSSFPLNRRMTTELLGFRTLAWNSIYAQMGRGKTERQVAAAAASLAATLGRFSMDCTLYLSQNFGFISFPPELTTGSSLMPHKKNPDVFELIRARCNRVQAVPNELALLLANLPSGYHRDLQLTKEILFPALSDLEACIDMCTLMVEHMEVKENLLADERYRYIFSVEALNELVVQGVPFREAYREIGNRIDSGNFQFDSTRALKHTHEGSIGNLCLEELNAEWLRIRARFP